MSRHKGVRQRIPPAALYAWLGFSTQVAGADCTHLVEVPSGGPAPIRVDGATLNGGMPVLPGARVCVRGGIYDRGKLEFINFVGTPAQPIVITNVEGQVRVEHGRIYLDDSQHVEFAGDGDPQLSYGFLVVGSTEQAFGASQRSADAPALRGIHAHHVEIHYQDRFAVQAVGVRGFEALAVPAAIEDLDFHHFYIHRAVDAEGNPLGGFREGFYFNSSDYGELPVPAMRRVRIHHNLVQGSGWDGIQISAASECEVDHNVVLEDSRYLRQFQNAGIMLGKGSACQVHHNRILGGQGPGIYHQGNGGRSADPGASSAGHFYGNLIISAQGALVAEPDPRESGDPQIETADRRFGVFVANARDELDDDRAGYVFVYHNTIARSAVEAIRLSADPTRIAGFEAFNNLLIDAVVGLTPSVHPGIHHNLELESALFPFLDWVEAWGDPARSFPGFRLGPDSAGAIDAGATLPWSLASRDIDGQGRPFGVAYDIGADEYWPDSLLADGFETIAQ